MALIAALVLVVVVVATSGGGSGGGDNGNCAEGRRQQGRPEGRAARASGSSAPATPSARSRLKTGIDETTLMQLNPDLDPQALLEGQRIALR